MLANTNPVSPLLIAQITDMHLFADEQQKLLGLPTNHSFQTVVKRLISLQPQPNLLLLTGDLSQDGTLKSYEHVRDLLIPLGIPTYWVPGNHDCCSNMEQVLDYTPISSRKAFVWTDWRFLLINSSVPGREHGHLSPETLDWLDFQLELVGDALPAVVALHHPPFCVNCNWLDSSKLQNSEKLFAILARYPQVKLVLFGHIHQAFSHIHNGIHYLGCPSTSIQFKQHSPNFALEDEGLGFRLLNLYADGSWETRIERLAYEYQLDLAATGYR